jgi:hypothetical protein
MPAPSLLVQTTYAELLERCAAAAFGESFPDDGTFTPKAIKGRRYWYFQTTSADGRSQRYVGPESPELRERIAQHRQAREDQRERRALVSTLVRSLGIMPPIPQLGEVVAALARSGVFRLRSVLVGTLAYQVYPAMLGIRLPGALLQTSDIDVAQFTSVSIATGDETPPMIDVLKGADRTFREIPNMTGYGLATSYVAKGGVRIDFVTPNEGPDTDAPQLLPALKTHAQPLRFLDFLIRDPAPAVLLHASGIYVHVPAPERYAVHKLILSVYRPTAIAKRDKDLRQAERLIAALAERRPGALQDAWEEAYERGPHWRKYLLEGMRNLAPHARDLTLRILGRARDILPGIDLTFDGSAPRYDFSRDAVTFVGAAFGSPVQCAISREALDDHFGTDGLDNIGRVDTFQRNRSKIESLARRKYLSWPVEESEHVLVKTMDLEQLSNSNR